MRKLSIELYCPTQPCSHETVCFDSVLITNENCLGLLLLFEIIVVGISILNSVSEAWSEAA